MQVTCTSHVSRKYISLTKIRLDHSFLFPGSCRHLAKFSLIYWTQWRERGKQAKDRGHFSLRIKSLNLKDQAHENYKTSVITSNWFHSMSPSCSGTDWHKLHGAISDTYWEHPPLALQTAATRGSNLTYIHCQKRLKLIITYCRRYSFKKATIIYVENKGFLPVLH